MSMVGFRHRYFRPMHSGAADPKGRGNCMQRGREWEVLNEIYVQGSQSGGVCGLGVVDVGLRFVD